MHDFYNEIWSGPNLVEHPWGERGSYEHPHYLREIQREKRAQQVASNASRLSRNRIQAAKNEYSEACQERDDLATQLRAWKESHPVGEKDEERSSQELGKQEGAYQPQDVGALLKARLERLKERSAAALSRREKLRAIHESRITICGTAGRLVEVLAARQQNHSMLDRLFEVLSPLVSVSEQLQRARVVLEEEQSALVEAYLDWDLAVTAYHDASTKHWEAHSRLRAWEKKQEAKAMKETQKMRRAYEALFPRNPKRYREPVVESESDSEHEADDGDISDSERRAMRPLPAPSRRRRGRSRSRRRRRRRRGRRLPTKNPAHPSMSQRDQDQRTPTRLRWPRPWKG